MQRKAPRSDKPCDDAVLPRAAFILGDENLISTYDVKPKHKWNSLAYVLNLQ